MRVLQIGLSRCPGVIETFVMTYFRKLVNRGIVFDFIDTYGDGLAFEDEIKALGGKIFTVPNCKRHPIKARKEIIDTIKKNGYPIVHVNMLSAANLLPLKAVERAGSIPIAHSHNSNTHGILRVFMHNRNLKKLRKMNVVRLACGKAAGDWLFDDQSYQVIPNAISPDKFSFSSDNRYSLRGKVNLSADDFVIGFVGRLDPQKNPLFLIDILSKVKEYNESKNIKLLIVGDGVMRNEVLDYATRKDLVNDVVFAGIQKSAAPWYSAMDCFILPSLYEGFPIVCVEAQAGGLPCFVSENVSSEVNFANRVKHLPISGDSNIWADCIQTVINDGENFESRINGVINTKYDIDVSAGALCDLYNDLVNRFAK